MGDCALPRVPRDLPEVLREYAPEIALMLIGGSFLISERRRTRARTRDLPVEYVLALNLVTHYFRVASLQVVPRV